MEERELFSIKDSQAKSMGVKVTLGQPATESRQRVIAELSSSQRELGIRSIGEFIWQGGNLGDLWNFQLQTFQFIVDNIGKVK